MSIGCEAFDIGRVGSCAAAKLGDGVPGEPLPVCVCGQAVGEGHGERFSGQALVGFAEWVSAACPTGNRDQTGEHGGFRADA